VAKLLIANRFEITDLEKDLLGRGGMGVVYRATDTQSGETVAVKALNAEALANEPTVLERFQREGESLRKLNHPNIVKYIAAVESNGQHYLVMEYIDGGSLQGLLSEQGSLPSQRAIEIGLDLADALVCAHRLGIVYRDLKPANVLLAKDGTPRLTDFGVIQLADSSYLTQTGMLVGTVNYLSPEAINSEPLDVRADIWAFGVLLFEMLTGQLPFTGKNLTARITAIITQPVPDISQYNPNIPKPIADLIYSMLKKDRNQRIPSMRQVGAELESILSSLQGLPTSLESRFKTPNPFNRNTRPDHPTGTVTFLFTDIEASTKLAQQYPEATPGLLARHNEILNQAVESHNGFVFQVVGDSYAVSFHNADDAVNAALQAQRNLQNENWNPAPIKVRMGIHTGAAQLQVDNKENKYSGYAALALTQRIMSAGHGGQILLSQTTHELTRDKLPENAGLIDMGERRLKDVLRPEGIYQLNVPDLPNEFPELKTLDTQLNNLPVQLTPFVGREREITSVLGIMRKPDIRLVTLTGAGGTGKTRLSLQVAADLLGEYEHGVWFIELASVSNPELVLPTIASTLKVKEFAGTSIEQTLHENLSKRNLLLVIDNFEQVVSAAPAIGRLLSAAPKIKVLTSSREVLHLRGEHDYPVPPLGLPESKRYQSAAVTAQYEAVALFIQHAQAANPSFELDEENASIVAEICTRLDGLPLAIELAAARSRMLKPSMMLEKLKSRLNVLTGGARDLPHRQQTIRGAIDWSYELLDDAEKVLFARLGVFAGGWTVESAEAVCGEDSLSGLESLLDKSLIRPFEGTSGETRFSMLETIREYAFEKLTQSGELLSIQQARANYINALLDKVIAAEDGPDEGTWFAKLDDDFDNLRSAVEWVLTHAQPLVAIKAGARFTYWVQRSKSREPIGWLEHAISSDTIDSLTEKANAMKNLSNLIFLNDIQRARNYLESALDLYRQAGDQDGINTCLHNLGNDELRAGNFDKARQLLEQSLAGRQDDTVSKSITLLLLGWLARIRGEWQASRDYYLRAQAICEHVGSDMYLSYSYFFLGGLAGVQRDLTEARMYFEKLLKARWLQVNPLARGFFGGFLGYYHVLLGNHIDSQKLLNASLKSAAEFISQDQIPEYFTVGYILEGKARLELLERRAERAAQLFGASWTRREQEIFLLTEFERPDYEAAIAEARSATGDAAFEAAFIKGQAMTLEEAVEFALQEGDR
jgi:predicted ATPase/serine/threonine protein kinase